MLYLENNQSTGAFSSDRLLVIKLLTTQAAISLENALLYQNLEQKVTERTQELHQKNQDLQQTLQELQRTQAQLIQTEKMSSLGQMVAGIAHEINNPITFIHGNLVHVQDYVQDLLNLIAFYQQEYEPNPQIQELIEEINIDFITQDLDKIINSMQSGSKRIRDIILGLRNFSRLDEAEIKPVDIHEGIDSTLMILQHRLHCASQPEIQIIKEYAKLPLVNCYANQLNQVFLNILSNAIEALQKPRSTNPRQHPQIRIYTEQLSNIVRIGIVDNGSGMSESILQKIFDPFFTTKPVGSGTGLGLSISYSIVVEKHRGKLTCKTALGQGAEFVIEIPTHLEEKVNT